MFHAYRACWSDVWLGYAPALPGGSAGYYTYNPAAQPPSPMTRGVVFTPLGLSRLGGAVVVATNPDTLFYIDGGEKATFRLLDGKWAAVSAAAPGAHVQSALYGYGQPDLDPPGTWLITSVNPPARAVGGEPALAGWTITHRVITVRLIKGGQSQVG